MEGLRLLFDTSKPVHTPQLLLQWCITKKAAQYLKEIKQGNLYLLIATVDELGREERQLVPLDRMQKLIQFSRPGKHEIHACIVEGSLGSYNGLRKYYLTQRYLTGSYDVNVWKGSYIDGISKPDNDVREMRITAYNADTIEPAKCEVEIAGVFSPRTRPSGNRP